jgi:chlorite dismutase
VNTQEKEPLDLSEKGGNAKLDRRLFVQLQAFGGCKDASKVKAALPESVVYEDVNDPQGVGVVSWAENPEDLVTKVRPVLAGLGLVHKPEFAMLGRTYSLGYEPNLEDWLIKRTPRVLTEPSAKWGVWYPLRRTGAFSQLPKPEQQQILREHGIIGRAFGDAGFASDVRLACAGLDKNDNDFVIGLIGKELHPLSALVEAMRPTQQTSKYIENLGPFFVGRRI